MSKPKSDNTCENCARWEPYNKKKGSVWFGHCTARKADTPSDHTCHKFRDMWKGGNDG